MDKAVLDTITIARKMTEILVQMYETFFKDFLILSEAYTKVWPW